MELHLEDIVSQVFDLPEVVEHIMNAVLDNTGRDELIALGEGFQCIGIQYVIECEDRSVNTFPWVRVGIRKTQR